MRRWPIGAVLLVAAVAAGIVFVLGQRHTRPQLVVGGVEDAAKWADPGGNMALAQQAGFRTIVLSSVWARPATTPGPAELDGLRRAIDAAEQIGIRPIVAVYSFSGNTPVSTRDREEFGSYAASILRAIPELPTISLGNEPNSNEFWMPQFGPSGTDAAALAYFRLLETAYPLVKAADPHVTVIGGSLAARGGDNPRSGRPTHSPTRFIEDLGAAFRASGLAKPPLDLFSIHPYPANSSIPPTVADPHSTSIGIADYPKLVRLLTDAFDHPLPIVYGEYGIQTEIPRAELDLYSGRRASSIHPVSEARQADDYVEAIRLAACQPLVRMLVFFHVTDESQLTGLQTGLYYPNAKPKEGLRRVAAWAQAAENGQVRCRG
ncbi:MAG TPA: hypothetical protein VHZ77_01425 [Gaiellaceae bacterium]|jgi:hypothetical protein|nr:hypothetical protein [Gaiellaceae bacterium]